MVYSHRRFASLIFMCSLFSSSIAVKSLNPTSNRNQMKNEQEKQTTSKQNDLCSAAIATGKCTAYVVICAAL